MTDFFYDWNEKSAAELRHEINALTEQLKDIYVKDYADHLAVEYLKSSQDRSVYLSAIDDLIEFMLVEHYPYYSALSDEELDDLAVQVLENSLSSNEYFKRKE